MSKSTSILSLTEHVDLQGSPNNDQETLLQRLHRDADLAVLRLFLLVSEPSQALHDLGGDGTSDGGLVISVCDPSATYRSPLPGPAQRSAN